MGFVIEWSAKIVSDVIGKFVAASRTPKHLKQTGFPCCWIDGTRQSAYGHLIVEEFSDAFELVRRGSPRLGRMACPDPATAARASRGALKICRSISARAKGIAALPGSILNIRNLIRL